jgi:hypothetical protein
MVLFQDADVDTTSSYEASHKYVKNIDHNRKYGSWK